jgi:hypothetical protein
MIINLGHGYTAVWNGGHYVNYFDNSGRNYDCVSFAWQKDKPTFMDAWSAFFQHESDMGI